MTYSLFLILFVILPTVVLFFLMRRTIRWRHVGLLAILATIAVVYTTPWDNYLVATGVWYYDPKLVMGITLGYVPIEEYTFFILQTFMSGMFALLLWRFFYPQDFEQTVDDSSDASPENES